MGYIANATCLDCHEFFTTEVGGGFAFHLLRCDKCGNTKSVAFSEIGELHLSYLKGSPVPYSSFGIGEWEKAKANASIEPISEEEYHRAVETIAGECSCSGNYTFNAPLRCPKCHSTKIKEYEPDILID